ncbi:GNAT family N-acetyltransferase [Kribbella sp. NBC_00709]|uniref:GNAT family N-acetyltransferase n=1 Tax=Kribbella sp. NBC_00709 TaxID=2975972 RepID=UPI002E2C4852|nr:GNAT family N-acetyltransferase [Kribbella sp. NBC_00709]
MEIRPATRSDVDELIESFAEAPAAQYHVRGRWDVQQRDDGLFLLARRDGDIVGQTMILRASKYDEVQAAADPAEINGLHAFVRGEGVGTALIRAAEAVAGDWGRPAIGLGVSPDNPAARRLYERLGYELWSGPRVIDRWTEQAADGTVVRTYADECDYLLKRF